MIKCEVCPAFIVFFAMSLIVLSYDIASGSEITPWNKIHKTLVLYRFSGKRYDVHSNVVCIMTKL